MDYVDTAKFGKLNHMEISDLTGNKEDNIDWTEYGRNVVKICTEKGINYKIKYRINKRNMHYSVGWRQANC